MKHGIDGQDPDRDFLNRPKKLKPVDLSDKIPGATGK